MQLVYYAHSYREEDARLTKFFLMLLNNHGLTPSLDPPSDQLNSAKLERHLRSSDGLVAVLTWRDTDTYSKYIFFEILLGIRARKPVLVFVEDSLPDDLLPRWILQRRFSRRFYGRQVRELRTAIVEFKAYLGDDPPARYGAGTSRRSCVLTGCDETDEKWSQVHAVVAARGYEVLPVDRWTVPPWSEPQWFSTFADLDVAVCNLDASTGWNSYLAGVLHATFVPTINISSRGIAAEWLPPEFQPCNPPSDDALGDLVDAQFDVFEQDFLEVDDVERADSYVTELVIADAHRTASGFFGETRSVFMGDQFNITGSQVGAVGDHNVVAGNTFQQLWAHAKDEIDLAGLADQLERLRAALQPAATTAEQVAALGEAAQAEIAARAGDGPTVLQRLRAAGRWLLEKAEEIGTPIVAAAVRHSLGI